MAADDLELLDAWRAGERGAGEKLFERHFDAVFRFMRNKVGEGAEDLVQQAFLACVEGRDRFRQDATFRTYLFAAARNIVIDHWRARNKREMTDFSVTSAHDLGPSPSSALAAKDDERLLVRALRRIPLDYQMAIELFYVEGLKSREVAEVLDIPHATVRSRLRRGLEQVRGWVEQLSEDPDQLSTTVSRLEIWARELHEREE